MSYSQLFLIFTQFYSPPNCYHNMTNPVCNNTYNNDISFTIHGLWPEWYNNTYPQYCNNNTDFNISSLDPIMDDLNKYWVSYEGDNPAFWKHEYMKHATCYPNITEFEFFNKTLNIYKQLNTTQFFKQHIQLYHHYDLIDLETVFNGTFRCGYPRSVAHILDGYSSDMVNMFMKCFQLDGTEMSCPGWLDNGSCQSKIYFSDWEKLN